MEKGRWWMDVSGICVCAGVRREIGSKGGWMATLDGGRIDCACACVCTHCPPHSTSTLHTEEEQEGAAPSGTTATTTTSSDYANVRLSILAARELEEETAGTVVVEPRMIAACTFVDTGVFHRCVYVSVCESHPFHPFIHIKAHSTIDILPPITISTQLPVLPPAARARLRPPVPAGAQAALPAPRLQVTQHTQSGERNRDTHIYRHTDTRLLI